MERRTEKKKWRNRREVEPREKLRPVGEREKYLLVRKVRGSP